MRRARITLAVLAFAAGCAADGHGEGTSAPLPGSACDAAVCGPAPKLPSWICADGSTGGPTGRCVRQPGGGCGWEIRDCPAKLCGGIAGLRCPDGFDCVDDPRDDCDPQAGGADCGGVCTPAR
jgi:hypothetical protein